METPRERVSNLAKEPVDPGDWEPLPPDLINSIFGTDLISHQLAEAISELNRQSNQLQQVISSLDPPFRRLYDREFWPIAVLDVFAMATVCIVSLATRTYSVLLTLMPVLLTVALVCSVLAAARVGASREKGDGCGATIRPESRPKQVDLGPADGHDAARDDAITKPADDKSAQP